MEILIQKPGEVIRPNINSHQINRILKELYGLDPLNLIELNSYEDRNFHIKDLILLPNSKIAQVCRYGYTLKILNSLESQNPQLIEAQNQLLIYLQKNGIRCPQPVQTIANEDYRLLDLSTMKDDKENRKSEKTNIVRLLTYIPGEILDTTEYNIRLFNSAGKYLSKLHETMKSFNHPEFEARISMWSMSSFPYLIKFLHVVDDPHHVRQVRDVIRVYQEKVETFYNKLRKGLIHGDFNEQNILIENREDGVEITGILDFADAQVSYYVFDIAIAIAYVMLKSDVVDPAHVGGHFLAGYCIKRVLDEADWEVLKTCIAARLCVSLVMGLYNYTLDNKNEYVLQTQKRGWEILENFWAFPEKNLIDLWKNIQTAKKM